MKAKKIPMRTCIVCHTKAPKKDLLRIVKNKEEIVKVDLTGKMNGHGVYIMRDLEMLDKAIKDKILERQLECSIDPIIYDEIRKVINKSK